MTYQKLRELDRITKEQIKSKYYFGFSKDVRPQATYHATPLPRSIQMTQARDTNVVCTSCYGKGMVLSDNGFIVTWAKCPTCSGTKEQQHFNPDEERIR